MLIEDVCKLKTMGKRKEQRLLAVNCTIAQADLDYANSLGVTEVKGRRIVNTSHGFREVFKAVRHLDKALQALYKIQQNPDRAADIVNQFFATVASD